MKQPFFSVCVLATKREKTIYDTLLSLCAQTFQDFEVIVTFRDYNDRTHSEIERFKETIGYLSSKISFSFYNIDCKYESIKEWNDPLQYAEGDYIAMLEGDDQYLPNHLEVAYNNIRNNPNVGIYATGNQYYNFKKLGFFVSGDYFKYILSLSEVPPPSQNIFIRLNTTQGSFLYNTDDYIYAPEIDLYLRIASEGFNAFISDENSVFRDVTPSITSGLGWKYFRDHLYIVQKYGQFYDAKSLFRVNTMLKKRMLMSFIRTIVKLKSVDLNLLKGILCPCYFAKVAIKTFSSESNKLNFAKDKLSHHESENAW